MSDFNEMVRDRLKSYVYALTDPRHDPDGLRKSIFYIGKGTNNRCFNHAKAVQDRWDEPLNEGEHKLSQIREIIATDLEVGVQIVAHGLSDDQALEIEAILIPLIGETNKISGHGSSGLWLEKNQVIELYDDPVERKTEPLLCGNLLVVSLNRQDTDQLRDDKTGQAMNFATLGDWNLGKERSRIVDCVVGVRNGLVVSLYSVEKKEDGSARHDRIPANVPRGHGRSRFYGKRETEVEAHLVARSIFDHGRQITKIRPGAACEFYPRIHDDAAAITKRS